MNKSFLLSAISASLLVLTGCSTTVQELSKDASQRVSNMSASTAQNGAALAPVRVVSSIRPVGRSIEFVPEHRSVGVNVVNGNLVNITTQLAQKEGYTTTVMPNIDSSVVVTTRINTPDGLSAIRQLAWHAGYVAIINKQERTVTLATEATMVFKVPSEDLRRLMQTSFSFGGNPISGGSSGDSGGGASFQPISSDFSVTGEISNSPEGFSAFVQSIAGSKAVVNVFLDGGLIMVRSNGQALKRIHDFLVKYSYDARRQVEINAKVIEVALGSEFRYGIQWDKLIGGNLGLSINHIGSGLAGAGSNTLTLSNANINSVIQALESVTDVEVMSTPQMVISNNSSGVIFEGVQRPYMPSITSTTQDGITTLSGTSALASDGVQMSIYASVLDDANAVLTVVPSTVVLGDLKQFLDGQIQVFEQSVRNGGQRISIRSGETVVISGNRYQRANNREQGLPGFRNLGPASPVISGISRESTARQTVILMNARILNPDPVDVIYSESI